MRRTRLALVAVIAVFALIAAACGDSSEDTTATTATPATTAAPDGPTESIAGIVAGGEDFTTLLTAVEAAGLTGTLDTGGPFTVFAPTNEAFAALPEGTLDALLADTDLLTEVLLYHVVDGAIPAEEIVDLSIAPTLQGENIGISVDNGVFLNESTMVIATNIFATNGIVHVIDSVLVPQSVLNALAAPPETTTTTEAPLSSIAEIVASNPDFSTLLAAVEAAGLTETLDTGGPFTVFAPTNAAFAALPEGTLDALLADTEALTEVLLYHLVDGAATSDVVVTLDSVTTLQGSDVTIEVVDGNVVLNGSVNVTAVDILASNGVIHVIDAVLIPPPAEEGAAPSIAEIVASDPNFSTLLAALEAASLTETLDTGGPFTVFAPTNAAFDALPDGTLEALLADTDALTDVLLYHVADGAVTSDVVVNLDSVTTLQGSDIAVSVVDGGVVLNDSANVTAVDIIASNGVIHVIDAVLIPPAG